eukprot:TRINITY_DN16804_c0_g2_i1.p1 TRINITY_DN16804_c0_g2~~TRINITY_DN16804_c0_g2_i1.p1  ORF type:complete len:203 (+),score=29.51 TRINITY_DN16804_c0_g2_i1:38-610(+)
MSARQSRSSGKLCLCAALAAVSAGYAFLSSASRQVQDASRRAAIAAAVLATTPAWAEVTWQEQWLAEKEKQFGVKKLPSGLMYRVLKEGPAGGPSPKIDTKCSCTYAGQLPNGKQFDAGTIDFAPNQVIRGWTEAMQLMKEGDKWELFIPPDLAYGSRGAGNRIPPNAPLQFQIQINKVGVSDGLFGMFR